MAMTPARSRWLLVIAGAALLAPVLAGAQAWLPPKGTLSYSLTYNDVLNLKHYLPDGNEIDVGHTRTHAIGFAFAYSPTDRLTLMAGIPYVMTRYWGEHPHPTELDDGHEHSTFTDLRISAHYQVLEEPFALAPYVAVVIPSHDYETLGHAAPGRGLTEYWLGFGAGKNLDAWLPRTYVQMRYNYAFVEKVAGVKHDQSNVDLEVGYFITSRWSIRALGYWQFAHGGIDVPIPPSDPLYPYHDQLAATTFLNVGAGAAWAMNRRTSLYVTYLTSLHGTNGHKLDQGLTVGTGFSF
jgi:hypothetical protein